jgi:hypothetical protein
VVEQPDLHGRGSQVVHQLLSVRFTDRLGSLDLDDDPALSSLASAFR